MEAFSHPAHCATLGGFHERSVAQGVKTRLVSSGRPCQFTNVFVDPLLREGAREQISLTAFAAAEPEFVELVLPFYSFRNASQLQAVAHVDDRANEVGNSWIDADAIDETLVNLDLVKRQIPDLAETRITGAKIVQRHANASSPKALDGVAGIPHILHDCGFRNFGLKALRR